MDPILAQAAKQEEECDWSGAVLSYDQVLGLVSQQDFSEIGEIWERRGYASYRLAMQSDSVDVFRDEMHKAVASYGRAREFYCKLEKPSGSAHARILRCDAMVAYMGYWLASLLSEKKRLAGLCWGLTKEACSGFERANDADEYWRTFDRLSLSAFLDCALEMDFQAIEKTTKEAMEIGEKALSLYLPLGNSRELARAHVKIAGCLESLAFCFSDLEERERYFKKAINHWLKANELSKEAAHIGLLDSLEGGLYLGLGPGTDKALATFLEALAYGKKTKDKVTIGWALDCLAFHNHWRALAADDPNEVMELADKALQYAEDARRCYSAVNFISGRGLIFWIHAPLPEYYWLLAIYETDQAKKRELLEKAQDAAPEQLRQAEASGYPETMWLAHHVLSKVLGGLAKIELDAEKKRSLLEEALSHRSESIRIHDRIVPFDYWNRGMMLNYLANIKQELASLSGDTEAGRNMLQRAVIDKEDSLKLCIKELKSFEMMGSLLPFASVGRWQYEYGNLLNGLYESTSSKEHLKKSVEAYEKAAELFQRPNLTSRMAECYWKAARMCTGLDDHMKASGNFDRAASSYRKAAGNVPQLRTFYEDHALYMEAWSEIEKALYNHTRQEYGLARDHFDRSAQLHKSLRQWSYLAPNYAAWAQVELAEELSRKEQGEEAFLAFEKAATLFEETKKSLQTELGRIADTDEKIMAENLSRSADQRREYCTGRIALEQARILDRKGDHHSSFEKYGLAAETFESIAQEVESEQDRKELRLIAILSRAWQKMTRAEAEAAPSLYSEASELFEQAKEFSSNEKATTLAMGHSRFCKALEAGNKFADSRDKELYSAAVQHLESAANYYLKAGFQKASEYAKATELLLDAYMYMDTAKKEIDPEKRAKLCMVAERVLEWAAGSFLKAEHEEKREQVLRLVERVREERELAMSLTEVLHAPSIVSTTNLFATPTPTRENAVGLERFENADVQANLVTQKKELKVGEDLHLRIDLINAGKCPAFLTRISNAFPDSFDLVHEPEICSVENRDLNMKGRQLKPLKAEEIDLILRPMDKGTFIVKPRILYLDESGHQMSCEPDPQKIVVSKVTLPSRVPTGFADLDNLLLGGLPENRVVIVTSPPCDERDMIVQSFLKTGAKKGEETFYLTIDADATKELAKEHQSNFHLFVCNPKAYDTVENLPNAIKLSIENPTEISIALTSAFRQLGVGAPRRACIAIISDVLLQHGTLTARRWLAALIPELRLNHFTALALINPHMHPSEGTQAILDLFDGEISIFEKETKSGMEKRLKVRRLCEQGYLETDLILRKNISRKHNDHSVSGKGHS